MESTVANFAIQAEGLTKSYGSLRAVDGLSLSVLKGEIFGFLGPNGAGKTTSIKMLCGLQKPDSGTLRMALDDPSKSVGLCPQNIIIWDNMTCIEQLVFMGDMYGLPRRRARARGMEILETLGLAQKRDSLAKTLSGGMQRRLNIALALIHDPEILILDEPQAGLDPQSRVLVRDYIGSLKSKTTIILTTHDMEEAEKLSDRVCIMDHGKALVTGTVEEIKRSLGQGDVFEIEIDGDARTDLLPYLRAHAGRPMGDGERRLSFMAENAQETMIEVMSVVKERSIRLRHVGMRSTSLEDVFIHLTGRSLRP